MRDRDLDVLARALALAIPEVEQRLEGLMVSPTTDLHTRTRLLRARVLVPAAGVLVAITVAGALIVSARSGSDPDPAPAPPVAQVPVDDSVDIGGAATVQRNPDGSPGVEVVTGENLSGSQIPAGAAGIGDAQVATRDAAGNVVQTDRSDDDSTPSTSTP
jgi:hypothetical protein